MTLKQIFTTQSDVVLVKGDVLILESIWCFSVFLLGFPRKNIDILNVYSKSAKKSIDQITNIKYQKSNNF